LHRAPDDLVAVQKGFFNLVLNIDNRIADSNDMKLASHGACPGWKRCAHSARARAHGKLGQSKDEGAFWLARGGGHALMRAMKAIFPLCAAALLAAACASSPAASIPSSAAKSAKARPGARPAPPPAAMVRLPDGEPAALLARVGQPDALSPLQAAELLGPPDVYRRDGVGALLTWRLESCALVLGFVDDRLAHVSPDARIPGAPAPSLNQCVAEARARAAKP
jgi:hypothetical protein